jgi:biopolymer transport protein ExbB
MGIGAGWVLWLLIGLSVLSVAIVIERSLFFYHTRINALQFRKQLKSALAAGELELVLNRLGQSLSLEACVVGAGACASCPAEAEERMAAEAQMQRLLSERYLAFLGTLGNNAPFIGLLGTVIGIIGAFGQLEVSGGQLTAGLMANVGEALVATAVGLLVALPAVAAYNAFQRAIQVRLNRADALGRELIAHMHAVATRTAALSSAPAPGVE